MESVMIAPWPALPEDWRDPQTEQRMGRMQELVRAVREVRNRYMIDPKTALAVFVRTSDAVSADFDQLQPFIRLLAGVGQFQAGPGVVKPPQSASCVTSDFEAYVSLAGLIDVTAEIKRLDKQIAEKKKHLAGIQAKLKNASFVDKAPKEVVQQQRDMEADFQVQIKVMEENLRELRGE
jgi:valyl-tRNA synthetase